MIFLENFIHSFILNFAWLSSAKNGQEIQSKPCSWYFEDILWISSKGDEFGASWMSNVADDFLPSLPLCSVNLNNDFNPN